jgi:ParB family chromosome partitioning protein
MAKKALGKGLGAIISTSTTPADDIETTLVEEKDRIVDLKVDDIIPNPDQPRLHFDENEIKGLSESIKAVGLIQPIIVRKGDGQKYIVVAGERRLRATKLTEKTEIRAIVIEADEEQNLSLALIENIQRENLDPIEEAKAYKMLANRFKLKQQDIAERVGKERATVTNSMRLLNLPEDIQEGISEGKIAQGHAKVLLGVASKSQQIDLYNMIVEEGLSVRALEKLLKEDESPESTAVVKKQNKKEAHIKKMEDKLVSKLGTKVEIRHAGKKGKIEISYYSLEDFERIVEMIK